MTKKEYRKYFLKCKNYLKFSSILKEVKISDANFSHFLNNADSIISIEKLELVKKRIEEIIIDLGDCDAKEK